MSPMADPFIETCYNDIVQLTSARKRRFERELTCSGATTASQDAQPSFSSRARIVLNCMYYAFFGPRKVSGSPPDAHQFDGRRLLKQAASTAMSRCSLRALDAFSLHFVRCCGTSNVERAFVE